MQEPVYRVWMEDWVPPAPCLQGAAGPLGGGAELAEPEHRRCAAITSAPASLDEKPGVRTAALPVASPLSIGMLAGHWCAYGLSPRPAERPARRGCEIRSVRQRAARRYRLEILGADCGGAGNARGKASRPSFVSG